MHVSSQQSYDCEEDDLDSLPDLPISDDEEVTPANLQTYYWLFHTFSAHFHFMLGDWKDGESCSREPERLIEIVEK